MRRLRSKAASGFIDSERDVAAGVTALRRVCPVMRRAHDVAGDLPLRRPPGGFEGLARIIVGQQLSVASAAAIWGRLAERLSPLAPDAVIGAPDDVLRAVGLSAGKIRTLRAIADAITTNAVDLADLDRADDAAVHEALCSVKGIGPWTADIYIMFCLGRADAFAAGDLALQVAAAHAAGLDERMTPAELLAMAERWRPWRGVAARLLWAYYPHIKRSGSQGEPL